METENLKIASDPLLIDGKTVQFLLGISATGLWRVVKAGHIKPVKIGRKTLYRRAEIEAFVGNLEGAV